MHLRRTPARPGKPRVMLATSLSVLAISACLLTPDFATAAKKDKPEKQTKAQPEKSEPAKKPAAKSAPSEVDSLAARRKIDQFLAKGYQEHKIQPNPEIPDETFLRRVYLDIIGRVPTIAEAKEFLDSSYPDKRERLIDDLLDSEGYVSHNYNYWADILRLNRDLGNGGGAAESAYRLWLKKSLRENVPYDEFVRELVSARGHIWEDGAVGYYQRDRGMPLDNMSNTVRVFLGTRLECAQCHDHPFDKWTQMDYFKMAAFSYGMDARNYGAENRDMANRYARDLASAQKNSDGKKVQASEKDRERSQVVRRVLADLYNPIRYISVEEKERRLQLPHDYQYPDAKPKETVTAATMFGDEIDLENLDSMIDGYAEWMTSPDNPTFTKVIANRLWKRAFGVGLIEPVDELTDQTEPYNPELLAYLEDLIKNLDYDTKEYLRILYNTEAYQRAATTEEIVAGEPYYFPGPALRRLSAEQVWDSIVAMTIPNADYYMPRVNNDLREIDRAERIYRSLEEKSEKEYMAMLKEAEKIVAASYTKQDELRAAITKARAAEDEKKVRELSRKLNQARGEQRNQLSDLAYTQLGEPMAGDQMMASMGMGGEMMAQSVSTSRPPMEKREMPEGLSKEEQKRWLNDYRDDIKAWNTFSRDLARASELESPARRGHFLREFGQSDREVIENASDDASVPQALNLLNGPMAQALTNDFAVLAREMNKAETDDEKLETVYLAMLSRRPTEKEMERLRQEIDRSGEKAYESIVWALLNGQQFRFIQ